MRYITAILLFATVVLHADNLVFDLQDFIVGPISRRTVFLTPLSTPATNSNGIITSDSIRFFTDTSGMLTVTNIQPGNYSVNIFGPSTNTIFTILVPEPGEISAELSAQDLIVSSVSVPSAQVGYSQAAANALFVLKTNGWSANQILTNAMLNPGTGTSNYVWTLTNTVTGSGEWREAQGSSLIDYLLDENGIPFQTEYGDLLEPN